VISTVKNEFKYNFKDFTHAHYCEILSLVRQKFIPISYNDEPTRKNSIYWRHDVDFSLDESLNLARFEKKFDISATYFLLPHCEFYSIFEKKSTNIIKEIISLGHKIGLHFDTHFYGITHEKELADKLIQEKRILDKMFDTTIQAFSFHNTTPFTMSCQNWEYGGLVNTYASFFQEQTSYCSDSNGYWRHKRLWEFLNKEHNKPLQILTHPGWWTAEISSPKQKIERIVENRAKETNEMYQAVLKLYGRENIDW